MKEKVLSVLFVSFITIFLIFNILIKDEEISSVERRKLKSFPKISFKDIMSGDYMEDLDEYVTDQFVLRNQFRNIKAQTNYKLFRKLDNNGIYVIGDNIFKSEYPTNIKSINNFINKINDINTYLSENNNVYLSIIPDKNYYVDSDKYLNIDYNYLYERMNEINIEKIELRDILSLEDYYRTDTHWKQENLLKVVNRIGEKLNFKVNSIYNEKIYNKFNGVYLGQSALNLKPDKLVYLTSDIILNSDVYYYENPNANKVYVEKKLNNLDSYDVYLDGASSYIEIINKENKSGRELVVFRDSFASSLTPLLIEFYSKIILIDIRYINSSKYLKLIEFNNQDVLFLYSTLLVNNSSILK